MGLFDFISSPMQWIAEGLGGLMKQTGGLGLKSFGENVVDPYIAPVAKRILPLLPAAAGAYAVAPSLLAGAGGAGGGGAAGVAETGGGFFEAGAGGGMTTTVGPGVGGSSIIPEFLKKGTGESLFGGGKAAGGESLFAGGTPGFGTDVASLTPSNPALTSPGLLSEGGGGGYGLFLGGAGEASNIGPSGVLDASQYSVNPEYGPGVVDRGIRGATSFLPAARAGAGGAQYGGIPAARGGGGGIMSALGLGGRGKYLLPLMMGADYLTKRKAIGTQGEAIDKYLAQFKESTEWSESDREGMMTALMGIYSEQGAAAKRKAATSAAARGTGGGGYGRNVERIAQQGREAAARSLAGTYGPSGRAPDIAAYLAKGRSAGNETIQDWLGLGGQVMSNYMLSQILGGGR